ILNTINPKIVENSIDAGRLEIGVTLNDGLGLFGEGSASSDSDTNWAKTKGRKTSLTLKNGSSVQVIPCDASQMQSVEAFGKTFTIHKNLVASVKRIDTAWKNSNPKYDVKTIGGYNCRTIANSNKLSYHSYGLSVDINENTNGVNTAGNIPASFRKLWTDEGWGWGGSWSSYKDPMHFSKGSNEQGDMRGE
ncbi:M15 family metallopeptidase, partial [Patescibacteria group bacterium]|nr:M15 family metallopeptidase [Patescibacteria group bacterium]